MTQVSGFKDKHKTMWEKRNTKHWGVWKAVKACYFPQNQNGLGAHESDVCQAAKFTPANVKMFQRICRYL